MERTVNKRYMSNLELQSLHYWYKRAPLQNPLIKYNNVLKIMQNSIYKTDIVDTSNRYFTDVIQRPRIHFHNRAILRSTFEHWKMYVIHKLRTRRATYKADYFYCKRLQKKVLNALSKNVLLKWKRIVSSTDNYSEKFAAFVNCTKVQTHYAKTLVRQYFAYWCKYIALRRTENALLKEAMAFDNTRCLKKCTMHWKAYVIQRRRKQSTRDKAHEFYARNLSKKCIKAWIDVCEITSRQCWMENAILHYKNKLLKKSFNLFKIYHDLKIQKANKNEYVEEYSRKKLLKQYFERFVTRVNQSIVDNMAQERAEVFYNSKCSERIFSAWVEWYNKKVQNYIKISEIRSILESKKKSKVFSNWRLYVHEKKCKQRKLFLSQNFYKKKLIVTILRKLRNYSVYRKQKRMKLSSLTDKSEVIIQQLQIIFIEKWRRALYITVQEKRELNQAIKFSKRNLTHRYLFYWKEFSEQYKVKTLRKEKLYELASDCLLRRYVLSWRAKLQDVLETRGKEALAISAINYKMMRKYLRSWKQYIIQKVEMKNNIETAKELHEKLLLHDGLKQILRNCLRNIDYKYGMQLEDAATRSFKNFEILKEYFNKWLSLIYLKNNLKSSREITKNNDPQFIRFQISDNCTLNNMQNASLVVPEYIKKKDKISNISDLFVTLPENRSFHFP